MAERAMSLVLFLVGVAALGLAGSRLAGIRAPKPDATGELGEVRVYAQTASGPHPLTADRTAVLPRPQAVVFQLDVVGTGPRLVRIELEGPAGRQALHEERVPAPARRRSLERVVRFGEEAPDHLALLVTVEAPHVAPRTRRYPLSLATESFRFWDPPVASTATTP